MSETYTDRQKVEQALEVAADLLREGDILYLESLVRRFAFKSDDLALSVKQRAWLDDIWRKVCASPL